ncbi:hypothetical protein [Marinomonas atlantica]|uniref:hypothetical protein n=1 Tax=Marinomonas atlantica TaxID=1806668 RepID=UPI0008359FA5|nr:hypothetical protein [Marinomonas atlantica]
MCYQNNFRDAIEKITDEALDQTEPPHSLLDFSIWHLLTVSEDRTRMFFASWIEADEFHIFNFVDGIKYSLRHSISHVVKKNVNAKVKLPKKTIPQAYTKAAALLEEADKYENICRLIASTYNNRGVFLKKGDTYKLEVNELVDIRYSVLEGFGHGADIVSDITGVLYRWLKSGPINLKENVIDSTISNSVYLKKGKVSYSYKPAISFGLSRSFPQRDQIIPVDFEFKWGKAYKTHSLINSLFVRCFYHVLAVELAARKLSIDGGAESCLVLLISRKQLCEDLQVLADFSEVDVMSFIDYITFGNSAHTPDIAIQPLYKSKCGMLMVPCYFILNSNMQRNLLSLMAKVDKSHFDSQSDLFEKNMISRMLPSLKKWNYKELNKEFSVNRKKEELDAIIFDTENKVMLVIEMRWVLQPGDSREVYNRISSISKKVDQVKRKVEFVESNSSVILSRTFENKIDFGNIEDWKAKGIVVIHGFGGTISHDMNFPIVTLDIFCKGIKQFNSLDKFHNWLKSLCWLPSQGVHYDMETFIEDNGLLKIERDAARTSSTKQRYIETLQKSIDDNLMVN